ncbi:MAG: porin [Shewanella sp.]
MNKIVFISAAFTLLPQLTHASTDFYGRAWLGFTHSDSGLISSRKTPGTNLESYASFLGIKGKERLTDDLLIFYVAEVTVNGGFYDAKDLFKPRNTFLGLESKFGKVIFGRNDTVFKKTEGRVDLFNITSSDISNLIDGNDRLGDTLTYYSPSLAGVVFGATYQMADNTTGGDRNGNYGLSATYGDPKLKNMPYYLALGLADNLDGLDAYRAVAGFKVAGLHIGSLYQYSQSQKYPNLKGDSYLVSIAYPIDSFNIKFQILHDTSGGGTLSSRMISSDKVSDFSAWQASAGLDYQLSKKTTLSSFFTHVDCDVMAINEKYKFDDTAVTLAVKFLF